MKSSFSGIVLAVVAFVAVSTGPAGADPLPGEVLKFYQTPLNNGVVLMPPQGVFPPGSIPAPWPGHDELSTAYFTNFPSPRFVGTYMADDFCDLQSTPIVHVMWWGSYMNGFQGPGILQFLIAFESDVAATNELGYSHPGTNIISQIVTLGPLAPGSGTFTEMPVLIPPGPVNPDGNLYQYNAELAIPVPEMSNQVQWIKIVALTNNRQIQWGWHNRDYGIQDPLACTPPTVVPGEFNIGTPEQPIWHFQDDAVTGPVTYFPGPNVVLQTNWFPTFYIPPYDGINFSKDLAFALYTTSCPTMPTNPPTKWIELPDLVNGLTVLDTSPKILGDDFQCTLTGPITDIHLWGAWLADVIGVVTNFRVAFFSDIPATNDVYSRPGNELWSTNFVFGQYSQQFYTNVNEQFYNPNVNQIIGGDSLLFRYDFWVEPCRAFVQTNGVIYWLVVQALTTNGTFGWKSSTAHCHDDAVWGDTPGPFWNELRYPPGHPLQGQSFDLAFELTTSIPFSQWQIQYFGSVTNVAAAAGADPDGDGMSNTNEYRSGTVPTNSTSSFRIVSIERQSTTNVNLTWTTVGCHSYVVQTNRPVVIGGVAGNFTNDWADLSSGITVLGTGEFTNTLVHTGAVTNNTPALYYRVKLLCP